MAVPTRTFFLVPSPGELYSSPRAQRVEIAWDAEMAQRPAAHVLGEELQEHPEDLLLSLQTSKEKMQVPTVHFIDPEDWRDLPAWEIFPHDAKKVHLVVAVDGLSKGRRELLQQGNDDTWWEEDGRQEPFQHSGLRCRTTASSISVAFAQDHALLHLPFVPDDHSGISWYQLAMGEPSLVHEPCGTLLSLPPREGVGESTESIRHYQKQVVAVLGIRRAVQDHEFAGTPRQAALLFLGTRQQLFDLDLPSLRQLQEELEWYECLVAAEREAFVSLQQAQKEYQALRKQENELTLQRLQDLREKEMMTVDTLLQELERDMKMARGMEREEGDNAIARQRARRMAQRRERMKEIEGGGDA